MRALKFLLLIAALVGCLTISKVYAQDEGTLIKKSPPSINISCVEITPWGMMAGEYDGKIWNNPYNGIYLSTNLGDTWTQIGLPARGVTDISYANQILYAATYYHAEGTVGLFVSYDRGKTFRHAGLNFSASQVESVDNHVYLGGYSHGLWVSHDRGFSWEQKLGNGGGWTGPKIKMIRAKGSLALVNADNEYYLSKNYGETWDLIPSLYGKQPGAVEIYEHVILLGTSNGEGLYYSRDSGNSWKQDSSWIESTALASTRFLDKIFYLKQKDSTIKLLSSEDLGFSWKEENYGEIVELISDSSGWYAQDGFLFFSTRTNGVFRLLIEKNESISEQFLEIPWSYQSERELTDTISSYFDHEYPLLGYLFHSEDGYTNSTTLNFLGQREKTPLLYYSSHNGTDFVLPYGTEILAPAPGKAWYYYCPACGNTILVDHENNYFTYYMHLQKEGILSLDPKEKIAVDQGQVLGLVGLTGNTTGPHLHFQVMYDQNNNKLPDDYPMGLVDPFGWQSHYQTDPWNMYAWEDILGNHRGNISSYLWKSTNKITTAHLNLDKNLVSGGIFEIIFDVGELDKNQLTVFLAEFIKPNLPFSQIHLKYIEGTSITITGKNNLEEEVANLDYEVTITIDLTNINLENIVKETMSIFFWDDAKKIWEPLSSLFDSYNNRITAKSSHLSHFAVFGESIYPLPPESHLKVEGSEYDNWYNELPLITIESNDFSGLGIKHVVYSLDDGLNWTNYSEPFVIEKEGTVNVLFKAEDMSGNWEQIKNHVLMIDTGGVARKKIIVLNSAFVTK